MVDLHGDGVIYTCVASLHGLHGNCDWMCERACQINCALAFESNVAPTLVHRIRSERCSIKSVNEFTSNTSLIVEHYLKIFGRRDLIVSQTKTQSQGQPAANEQLTFEISADEGPSDSSDWQFQTNVPHHCSIELRVVRKIRL